MQLSSFQDAEFVFLADSSSYFFFGFKGFLDEGKRNIRVFLAQQSIIQVFFDLFGNIMGYIHFFFLEDLLNEDKTINFYLPFDGFKTRPSFFDVNQYLLYKKRAVDFVESRNKRIENYVITEGK